MNKVNILKQKLVAASLVTASVILPMSANASVASEAAMDSILGEVTAMESKAWLVVVPLVVAIISIKLFKKFSQKST